MQDARVQANDELGSLYERALQNMQTSVADSQTQAAEQAAARGMGSSGLSQDAMNKIAIAGLSQRGNLEVERTQKIVPISPFAAVTVTNGIWEKAGVNKIC
ncbi:hypothetical protein ACUOA8_41760, partial [Escherichia sp. SS-MK2]